MKEYDVLVVGSGSGMSIAANALEEGMRVAVVDKDEIGGTPASTGAVFLPRCSCIRQMSFKR